MVSLFYDELVNRCGLVTAEEFADLVALAQITPGPIGLNAATYIGQQQGGIIGAAIGTFGVMMPAMTIGILAAYFLYQFQKSSLLQTILGGIRPAVVGLIAAAVLFFAETSVFTSELTLLFSKNWRSFGIDWKGALIFAVSLFVSLRYKTDPTWVLLGGAAAGLILAFI